jgi:hypothetical protein
VATITIEVDPVWLQFLKVGDVVTRLLAGTIPQDLKVTEIADEKIVCGLWEFCRNTGLEIDDDLGWGPKYGTTGSYITRKKAEN